MTIDVFTRPKETYQRDINPIGQYIAQSAFYLSRMTGDSIEECERFIKDGIKNKKFPNIVNPVVRFFERGTNGDRDFYEKSLTSYIDSIVTNKEVLAPSGTSYLNSEVLPSLITKFTDSNTKKRSAAKKEQFKAKAAKDTIKYIFKNNEQTYLKLGNNSLSGAFVANGSFINNPSAHSTLTSTTRTGTSFANACNEKLLAGNRHYWSYEIVLNNIISIVNKSNYSEILAVIEKYNLVYPSVDDVIDCITYSSDLYWKNSVHLNIIKDFVEKLSPVERAAFVYTGDLYHIRKHNDQFLRDFISKMAKKHYDSVEDPLTKIKTIEEFVLIHAHHVCSQEVKGFGKDYEKMLEAGILNTLVSTALNIQKVVYEYKDFTQAFFATPNIPASVAYIRDMIRRVVVISDTDSTCFSVDEWIKWNRGEIIFDNESLAIASSVAYFTTQTFIHTMAVYSGNINVERSKLHTLAYKSEWTWTIVLPMTVAKHYVARAIVQEGNVFDEPELEQKGVHLKSSNTPKSIIKDSTALTEHILDTITQNKKLSIKEILLHVANKEREIKTSLLNGKLEYYRMNNIKDAAAYGLPPEKSPYQHHILWKQVFAGKYGEIEEPTYSTAKIPTILENPTKIKQWLETIQDRNIATLMGTWIIENKKQSINTFYISSNYLNAFGMPEEIKMVIDTKRIILDLCNVYYMLLESLGIFKKDNMTLMEMGY